ncbi:ABC transporter family protein (macronuclear) [Tetrahymena thermophila SB210]|uniref:ABC transporter family protein n=1 Tax=Tetrahymena thermophila (strain SB210) TaxID=312017 RepID=I7MHR7_TETTS|nr:ABC transporter family protein [Tetrahymena thermophila SB210]EAR89347.2 ABC transporter family protein [Tetrahymena thermophila SB210]|eukprot:XP_001009592.2 ABC transporter family protein [Tetrahymena thermophila SB210]
MINLKTFKRQSCIKRDNIVPQNLQIKQRKGLDQVLQGCSFTIKGGERVGCVGRTGAGKSSVIQVIFRMVPVEYGSLVMIDDIDIKRICLNTVRNSMSIISQMPCVFNGTVRRNLYPLDEYSEDQIWQSLKQTNLEEIIKKYQTDQIQI